MMTSSKATLFYVALRTLFASQMVLAFPLGDVSPEMTSGILSAGDTAMTKPPREYFQRVRYGEYGGHTDIASNQLPQYNKAEVDSMESASRQIRQKIGKLKLIIPAAGRKGREYSLHLASQFEFIHNQLSTEFQWGLSHPNVEWAELYHGPALVEAPPKVEPIKWDDLYHGPALDKASLEVQPVRKSGMNPEVFQDNWNSLTDWLTKPEVDGITRKSPEFYAAVADIIFLINNYMIKYKHTLPDFPKPLRRFEPEEIAYVIENFARSEKRLLEAIQLHSESQPVADGGPKTSALLEFLISSEIFKAFRGEIKALDDEGQKLVVKAFQRGTAKLLEQIRGKEIRRSEQAYAYLRRSAQPKSPSRLGSPTHLTAEAV
ncbi:hypothetical protein MJO28_011853 [Puccinia striiformis f. sp. tritici]|uniref:Uncharacterized protein n=1 Tax=Puccinia striiformis f. sp. tritici TaxID=168172 RepID=A0ACC0E3B1_9BASI|nr:hypothetical protein Pst134EB_022293 [Puccinia striiformis f. sp. tritici]KAI7944325.1 hypothetical protein MJO28_011853 [Puccinia striiformis f. sp. tritici]